MTPSGCKGGCGREDAEVHEQGEALVCLGLGGLLAFALQIAWWWLVG